MHEANTRDVRVDVILLDGTYELFRAHFGAPPASDAEGREVGATVGLLRSLLALVNQPSVTHIACAFDHTVESFRNDLFAGYKSSEGLDPVILDQFELAERAIAALGIVVYSMVEFEADDALATAAHSLSEDERVSRVVIGTPDKDLAQCVRHDRVVTWDRRRDVTFNREGVIEKFGVPPESIPDWLALVGDSADGIPGIPRWGAKSAAAVLREYPHLELIPTDPATWAAKVRGARTLSTQLESARDEAHLYRRLATLRTDVPLDCRLDTLEYKGADPTQLGAVARELGRERLLERVSTWA